LAPQHVHLAITNAQHVKFPPPNADTAQVPHENLPLTATAKMDTMKQEWLHALPVPTSARHVVLVHLLALNVLIAHDHQHPIALVQVGLTIMDPQNVLAAHFSATPARALLLIV